MADLRADLAALRSRIGSSAVGAIVRDLDDRGGVGDEWRAIDRETQTGIVAAWSAIVDRAVDDFADPYLAALARIAEIVADTDPSDGTDDYRTLDEIRAVLAGAAEGGG